MPDDPNKMSLDHKLIPSPYEVRDWCKSLGCSETELRKAVQSAGHSADKVREYIAVQRP